MPYNNSKIIKTDLELERNKLHKSGRIVKNSVLVSMELAAIFIIGLFFAIDSPAASSDPFVANSNVIIAIALLTGFLIFGSLFYLISIKSRQISDKRN